MIITLVAALARNRVIGKGNALPWRLPEDLKHFRELTQGGVVIMGRKTYESIGKPLPNRENWVISRQPAAALGLPPGVRVGPSLEDALAALRARKVGGSSDPCFTREEIFVIGGAQIYAQALPLADRLELTLIDHDVEGDATFPEWRAEFEPVAEEARTEPFPFRFTRWERRPSQLAEQR